MNKNNVIISYIFPIKLALILYTFKIEIGFMSKITSDFRKKKKKKSKGIWCSYKMADN